jgi:hypothetical protein
LTVGYFGIILDCDFAAVARFVQAVVIKRHLLCNIPSFELFFNGQ